MSRRSRKRAREREKRMQVLVIASVMVVLIIVAGAFLFLRLFRTEEDRAETNRSAVASVISAEEDAVQPFSTYGDPDALKALEEAQAQASREAEEAATASSDSAQDLSLDEVTLNDVENKIRQMTVEEKTAQLFFITPEALTGYAQVTQCGDATYTALKKYPVGGLIYFDQNLETPSQTKDMLTAVQLYAKQQTGLPLFLGVDEEGGRVVRIASKAAFQVTRVAAMGELAQGNDENTVKAAGATIGDYLHELGFNLDFAPVADVITNPENTAIGDRSFGTDKDTVSRMARAYAQGLADNEVVAVYKHFPGHGGVAADTHEGYAYTDDTLNDLRREALVPFQDAIKEGADMIMIAHISLPQVTSEDVPATLSEEIVTDLLREEMGFQGVVITDAMNMGAVSNHYGTGQSAVMAIQAGCDMILMPSDFVSAYEAVLNAVKNGTISESRIDESLFRILLLKKKLLQ